MVEKKKHSYFIYEFVKCHKEILEEGDPPCADMTEINAWLKYKTVHFRVLNDKIDFSKFDFGAIRQNEMWLPAFQLQAGFFYDTGYRYRENHFEKNDHWLPGVHESFQYYYDVTFFNSDRIVVDDDYTLIAEVYFRLLSDAVIHKRSVYNFMDWLGDIGGI